MKSILTILTILTLSSSCNDAGVASRNIDKAADQFEIYRRVVFYNGITDKYILSVEGYISIQARERTLSVLVKTKDGAFLRHSLGLSHNVTYFSEQLKTINASSDNYRVIFKPKALIPTIELDK